ncbi:ABC transporter ATP-binding protein [Nocardioides sp. Kera G14]|uniref:ABC transporter ATP-binding protein n=1 Tax=Nocardioides sp. Kera G14 TaxID=2884264 RepID=UPI001D117B4C|nr:ABC transporter ATP-binding protein [Nocardioides sp. Kera G14]UDY24700.1 ABC transporter ATP-binding protein [Nocardioides sp. Kera G14]
MAESAEPLLRVQDLHVTFPQPKQQRGDVHAVRGMSFDIAQGESLGIVGESGSGKSVTSLAIMGLLPPTAVVSGRIMFDGQNLLELSDREMSRIRGREVAMVFQDPLSALTPVHRIGDQIGEALLVHDRSLSKKAAASRAIELLRTVGIPDPEARAMAFPHEFSGGMRQRAMIAMAIANNPRLIVADEPTTALDVTIQAQILDVLEKARRITGAAVALITHDLGVVAGHTDRVSVMYAGKQVEVGGVDQVFARPKMPYTIGLLRSVPNILTAGTQRLVPLEGRPPALDDLPPGCPFAPRCPAALDACRGAEPAIVVEADGSGAACIRTPEIEAGTLPADAIFPAPEALAIPAPLDEGRPNVLEVHDLTKHFPLLRGVMRRQVGTVRAVDGVSFDVKAGRTMALVGESGCGKTTTALEILELTAPMGGSITFLGTDVSTLTARSRRRLRSDVQIVFQDSGAALDPRLPIGESIAEPLLLTEKSRAAREARVDEMLELVGLDRAMAARFPHELSGGQRQRIGIARALVTSPKLLVLDEPVSALDVSIQAGIVNLLQDLKERLGISLLFVAHDLGVVRQIADDVCVMYLGKVVEAGPIADVFADPRHPYSRALISAAPIPDPAFERTRERVLLEGDLPSPAQQIDGCKFKTRCPLRKQLAAEGETEKVAMCDTLEPPLIGAGAVSVACHHTKK